jgi:hypothetical protein
MGFEMNEIFSRRHRLSSSSNSVEITIRDSAPEALRTVIVDLSYECGIDFEALRIIVCKCLRVRSDPNNRSHQDIDCEIRDLLSNCDWYHVYDAIELIVIKLHEMEAREGHQFSASASAPDWVQEVARRVEAQSPFSRFTSKLNDYFVESGIGWKLVDGKLEVRGAEHFEVALAGAQKALHESGFTTAASELQEALSGLSRRPVPDVTGAIGHSMAAMECVAREVYGDRKATLGDILKRCDLLPKPLDEALTRLWGFASENGRHLREGREPAYAEAELVVTVVAGLSTYLVSKKNKAPPLVE